MMPAAATQDSSPAAPRHVAIIMDGNGRWAKARGLPRVAGHRKGAEAVKAAVQAAAEMGISYLTLYSFSSENWKRPPAEVQDLMGLLRFYLRSEVAYLHRNNVRLRVIGDRGGLDPDIVELIEASEQQTKDNSGLTLVLALNYGGRADILQAARCLADKVKAGELDPAAIDETAFSGCLSTAGIPDPDLMIRTSGEQRISNFLLWEVAYTEFVFLPGYWPDFTAADLEKAILEFQGRDRRFGAAGG